jgi:hypothetical protein
MPRTSRVGKSGDLSTDDSEAYLRRAIGRTRTRALVLEIGRVQRKNVMVSKKASRVESEIEYEYEDEDDRSRTRGGCSPICRDGSPLVCRAIQPDFAKRLD